ncbi:hypothetical protein MNBD_ACTINO01-2095, partial [hydrothermal vent metagenome]
MHHRTIGGSTDTEVNAVTVIPRGSSSLNAVMTVTVAATPAIMSLKLPPSMPSRPIANLSSKGA